MTPEEVVWVGAVASGDLEHVPEAACGKQADDGARAGEQRVQPNGRAVEEELGPVEPIARNGRLDRSKYALLGARGRGRHLPHADLAGRIVVEDQVGEGAADVNP